MRGSTSAVLGAALIAVGCATQTQGAGDGGPSDADADTDADGAADGGPDTDGDTDADGGADTDSETTDTGGAAGTWGMLINVTIVQTGVPLLQTQWVASRNWYLVEIDEQPDGTRVQHERACLIRLKLDTWMNQSIVPPGFVAHLPVIEREVEIGRAHV